MMNEILLDEKDKQIVNLTLAVRAYKKYDKERKKYIAQLEQRIVKLKNLLKIKTSEYDKLLNEGVDQSLSQVILEQRNEKLKNQKEWIANQDKKLALMMTPEFLESLSKEEIESVADAMLLKRENKQLHHKIKLLRIYYSDLLAKTVSLQLIPEELADKIIGRFPLENEDENIYEEYEEL